MVVSLPKAITAILHAKLTLQDHFDPSAYPEYTIARILEYGDQKAIAWLQQQFSPLQIEQVIRSERRLTRKSANFWALAYRIPSEEVAALAPQSEALS